MARDSNKPFIPRDKPKSWVLFICAISTQLLVVTPLMILGDYLESDTIAVISMVLFVVCFVVAVVMLLVYMVGFLRGRYATLTEQNWGKQVW